MSTIDTVAEHLNALGLRFRQLDDEAITIAFTGDNTTYEAMIRARGGLISVVAHMVAVVPRARIDEAIRIANALNATRVTYGAFWVDTNSPRIAFELAINAPEGPAREQVGMAMAALSQIDDAFPTLARVLWGGESAASAMQPLTPPAPEMSEADAEDEEPPFDMAV